MAEAQNKQPQPVSGTTRHVANETTWRAVCTAPDYCRVGKSIIAFDSYAFLTVKDSASSNVKAQGRPVYRVGDLFKCVQSDAGSHIVSGSSLGSGYISILEGQSNVKVNGIPVARHDSRCLINCNAAGIGGAPGKLVTEQKSVTASPAERPMSERMGDESGRVLEETWKGMKESAKTVWEAMPGTSDAATTAAARQKIGDGLMGAMEGFGKLFGSPSPEMVQSAYLSGNAESIALIEAMQEQQRQAVGAFADHVKQAWGDAEARNGTAGATAMVLTTLGVEVVGGKGMGALAKVAGRIAEIVKVAKSPLEAAVLLDKEIAAAKAAGRSADEIKLLEKARDERLAQARKEASKPGKSNEGVHVKKGRLPPNASYELNGYKYTTDAEGRIKSVEGNLKLEGAERNEYAQRSVGLSDGRLPDDQGGHLIGSQFGGYGGKENLTPMAKEINNYHAGEWGTMEKNWAERLRAGDSVNVKIEAIYNNGTSRASEFRVVETINGNIRSRIIQNPG